MTVGEGVLGTGVAGVGVAVGVGAPQATSMAPRIIRLARRRADRCWDMKAFLLELKYIFMIIQQTIEPYWLFTALMKSASRPYAVVSGPGLPSTILRLDNVSV